MQSTDCYSIYNKTSCEENPSCIFTKNTYKFCENKYNYMLSLNETNNEIDNECLLYIDEGTCVSKNKCLWNVENIYSCKKKEIENCLKLDSFNPNKCQLCNINYKLNSENTTCIKSNNVDYPCIEYSDYYTCINNPQCTYFDDLYKYCSGNTDEETALYKCNLYLTPESCESQNSCSWHIRNGPGCRGKNVDNCEKLREADPTSCEKCIEGYNLLSGMCTKGDIEEKAQCQIYDESDCPYISICEFSNRAFCSGENKECFRYLDKELCKNSGCNWNDGNLKQTCKERIIDNCLILSKNDHTCERCKDGYSLYDYNTYCLKKEDKSDNSDNSDNSDYHLCSEYYNNEERCFYNDRCEFSNKNYCDNKFENGKCGLYMEKSVCVEDSNCYWNTESVSRCKNKEISNCLELKYEDTFQCKKCKEGYILSNEDTECRNSGTQFIYCSFLILGFILL